MSNSTTKSLDSLALAPQSLLQRLAEIALIMLVFFIAAGDPPPHVNEAHYVCRLKHFWNPAWCAGDLFLESEDSQYVFLYAFGWVTRSLSLAATAWVGRFLASLFLAYAWQRLSWRVVPRPFAAALSAALFVTLNNVAHLAGEWVIGGVESKCFAYGFVLLALRELIDHRWSRVCFFLGAATAIHPLVGGWSFLICGVLWLLVTWSNMRDATHRRRAFDQSITSILPGLIVGVLIALGGIIPALLLTWNQPPEIVAEANRIYVFERLPHHLAPLTLPKEEAIRRILGHVALLALLFALIRTAQRLLAPNAPGAIGPVSASRDAADARKPVQPEFLALQSIRVLANFAWAAALLAVIGFAIELALWSQPLAAASLLRYYWFRLTDFAAAMATAVCLTALITQAIDRRRDWAAPWLIVALLFVGWQLGSKAVARYQNPVPPADQKLRDVAAWKNACQWAAENTPPDALFLTPRLNQTFKWRAGRPEVVNRKDVPQDARSIVEWDRRIKEIYYATIEGVEQPLDSLGVLGTDRVCELAKKYGAGYLIMDRGQLLSLPIAYMNDEYVIYRVDTIESAQRQ